MSGEPRQDGPRSPVLETDGEARSLARRLLRTARFGALGALDPETGTPIVTRVAYAPDMDAAPVFLASALSSHTGALEADGRASLLLGEPGRGDLLAHPRITVIGKARRLHRDGEDDARVRRRFLARHPKAFYAEFADFGFFRLEPEGALLNGGFGKAWRLEAGDILVASPAVKELAAAEAGAVQHMNEDHLDAIAVYARHLGEKESGWVIVSLDPDGIDLFNGERLCRLDFDTPLKSAAELRPVLAGLARRFREVS